MNISTMPVSRKIAGLSALALAAGGALLVSPAQAATSAPITYSCTFPVLGAQTLTATHSVPDTVVYGGKAPLTTTITIPDSLRGPLYNSLGARQIDGTDTNYLALAGGALKIGVAQVIPKTDVPSSGDMTVVAVGDVDTAPYADAMNVGDVIDVALDDRTGTGDAAADLIADLKTYNASGTAAGPFHAPCELNDSQTLAIGAVTVVQANTETATKLIYKAKKDKLIGKATVTAPDSGAPLVGDVKMVLKRNGKVKTATTKTLNDKGIAKMSWLDVKNGNYKLVAKYLGTDNFNTSGSTAGKMVG